MRFFEIENKIQYAEPNFDYEWDEAERYPEFRKLGKANWIKLARSGKPVIINDASDINNTDAADPESFGSLDKNKQKRALKQISSGKVEMPIVAFYPDGWKELVGGNTRLTALMAKYGSAKVWMFSVPENILLELKVGSETGEDILVLKNPKREALVRQYLKHGQMRGLQSGTDFFFWPASQEIHARMADKLGIEYRNEDRLGIVGDSDGFRLDFDESKWIDLLNNRYIKSVFDIDGQDTMYVEIGR